VSATTHRPVELQTEPEQQPWRTPEDRRGWKVVAVGPRHPGAFMREVQRYVQDSGLLGPENASAYREVTRAIVESLLGRQPETTTAGEIRRIVRTAFRQSGWTGAANAKEPARLTGEIGAAWRRYVAA
jgi:hypothetical protein